MHERFSSLDLLRGIAATMVFTFHFIGLSQAFVDPSQVPPLLLSVSSFCGGIGTNVLLLLSGFLVGKAESDLGRSYLQMLAKRAIRIYPAYAILVCAGLIAGMHLPPIQEWAPCRALWNRSFNN